jgi:hypothetical protein
MSKKVYEMPESPEAEARIAKIQKDVEELKEYMRDSIHDKPELYEKRVRDALTGHLACVTLWLEIDGVRSLAEIDTALKLSGHGIPNATLWRAAKRLSKGLIFKKSSKSKSPIYSKKPWAKELDMDSFVRKTFIEQKSKT